MRADIDVVLAAALAAGDDALVVEAYGALGRAALADGRHADALRAFREAAGRASAIGEGALARALTDLGVALFAAGETELADQTWRDSLLHLQRAEDRVAAAEVALVRARHATGRPPAVVEDLWAEAARRCAVAGLEEAEIHARLATAWTAAQADARDRALAWLDHVGPRLPLVDGPHVAWACGELGAAWLDAGRYADALPLLERAARELAIAGHHAVATERHHQWQLCRALLGAS